MEVDNKITGITSNSNEVKPGYIFVAIKGTNHDGHLFIEEAIKSGAKIIIHQDPIKKQDNISYIKVADPRIALSEYASKLYPSQPKYILGVTGTNGKTSIVHFIREILKLLQEKAVSIGTLGVLGDLEIKSSLTTPSTVELHKILEQIADVNINYTAIECSSHGIDQHRLDNVKFSSCGFSNFTQDHLDYHKTMENYLATKEKLFSLYSNGYAVLNADIPEFSRLENYTNSHGQKIITYGKNAKDIIIKSIIINNNFQKVTWQIQGNIFVTNLNLVGEFQVYNIACAIGLLHSTGISYSKIMSVLEKLNGVTGRMEQVANYNDASIFVDYAHTPDALEHALRTLKPVTQNKLWVVFGCGGNRDSDKRPIMGGIAKSLADEIIITDDNPRNENASSIRQAILSNCSSAKEIADRKEAIDFAISNLKPGDKLLVAGKGHENYQIIGGVTLDFSDKEIILNKVKSCK